MAIVATGRDPNNNKKVRQCQKCLHVILLWGNYFTMSNDPEASLGVLLHPCKQRNCMTKQSRIQVLSLWNIKKAGNISFTIIFVPTDTLFHQ